ncbi:hypothetical protein UA08_05897 [Talaromyces atroroseus]|uniref:Uncharacterized protein n=1 Tax=Talaromyces atroroseus TaxID=1441469 RepID=A0A225AKK3_TALAT|nr:hypothetical protein UA08_05897 [Talaromyces atroroseus]OKL58834.1 hypothetical protein UA08_05897 [Talaromyces atroroseus]
MSKYQQLGSRRQACCQRWLSSSAHVNSSTVAPSQLLRYALSGNPKNATTKTTGSKLDKELELVLSQQHFDFRKRQQKQKKMRLISLPGAQPPPTTDLRRVANLHELQLWFEQHASADFKLPLKAKELKDALLHCEKLHSSLEILSVLNAIITRRRSTGVKIGSALCIAGLYYSSQSFSPSAFRFYLTALEAPLKPRDSENVILCLLKTLRTIRLTNPTYDTRPVLELVAGENQENASSDKKRLIDMVELDDGLHSSLIELLLELGATKSHERVWGYLIYRIDLIKRIVGTPSSKIIDDAYRCILVFFKTGMMEFATSCLEQISEKAKKLPPSLHLSSELAAILNGYGLEVPTFIDEQTSQMDGLSLDYDIASTDNLRLDSDMVNFSIVESLLARIGQHGASTSASQIALVIDALNDCEGATIPLFIQSVEDRTFEFAWAPRWIPVLSPLESISFTRTLGLLRAQIATRKILISSERSRSLIQLGHLVQRELPSGGLMNQKDWSSSWGKTGYLVVFDRVSAEYLVIYMGENFKLIDPEYQPHPEGEDKEECSSNIFEQHPVLGSLSSLLMPTNAQDLTRDIANVVLPVENAADHYFIDLDSGNGLQP